MVGGKCPPLVAIDICAQKEYAKLRVNLDNDTAYKRAIRNLYMLKPIYAEIRENSNQINKAVVMLVQITPITFK